MEYFVYLTNECNLNCKYCSVLNDLDMLSMPTKPAYSNSDLIKLIEKIQIAENDDHVTIYLFGGEPSLEYDASFQLMNEIKHSLDRYDLKFVLHTNGLLLNQMPDKLLENLDAILCSTNYEMIPKYSLSDSYFSNVVDNVILTKKRKNITIIGRMTITEKTSLYTELLQFSPHFDYIYWQIANVPTFENYAGFYSTYTYETRITFMYWLQYLKRGLLLKYIPFMSAMRLLLFHDKIDTEFSCGYGSGMVYIQTDGSCYACSDSACSETHYMGNLAQGVEFPRPTLLEFRCARCNYRSLCLGRCGRMHKEFSKKQISRYCALNKFMLNLFSSNQKILMEICDANPALKKELLAHELNLTEFTP